MTDAVFAADPIRLLIAAAAGIILLLVLIIKFNIYPVLSLLISALLIGLGAGMPVPTLMDTVEKGAGETLQGIVLLIGMGSLFGGILEISGGAQCVAQTLVNRFGEKKAGIALGVTGLVVGTTVFFEAGVVILIPLAFGLAKKTKKSTLYYVIPLLAGFLLDCLLGDPYSLPHPIRLIGRFITSLEKWVRCRFSSRIVLGGVVMSLIVLLTSVLIPLGFLVLCYKLNVWLGVVLESVLCYYMLAARCLRNESMKVYKAIAENDTEKARKAAVNRGSKLRR